MPTAVIGRIIDLCAKHRWFVIFAFLVAAFGAVAALRRVPLDAIPDLSDPQVIVFTEWMGRSPTLVEDQVTYPIASALLAAPKVTDVRGFSMFGMSLRLRDLRGGHRRLLGALPRARVPELASAPASPRA